MKRSSGLVAVAAVVSVLVPAGAFAQAKPSKTQNMQTQAMSEIPHCARKLGTVSIMDGDDPRGWAQYNLASPQKLLKAMVQKSGCFNLVDRGAGLNAAQIERNIGGNLGMQRGSNVGQGQIKAADYVLVAEVQARDSNAGGGAAAGIIGGMIGGRAGGLIGGIKTKKLEANTVLSLTNVRTTETVAVQDGYAVKNDIGWGAGGGIGFAGAVGGGLGGVDRGDGVHGGTVLRESPGWPITKTPRSRSRAGRLVAGFAVVYRAGSRPAFSTQPTLSFSSATSHHMSCFLPVG